MRKFATAIMAFLLVHFSLSTSAQTLTVTGKVYSGDNNPVASATVLVKGKRTGTKTDANGSFTINANRGDVLVISGIGFTTQEIRVNGSSVYVRLQSTTGVLEEVSITTAMDIKRNPRELGYSVQTVKGSTIAETQRENFVNSLQGRVAGLTVTPTSGAAGGSTGIVLRGFNTLSGNNQPLFVVDGIILDNSTLNTNSQGGTGIGLASDGANRNSDATNRMADLNPNDIDAITVLKGPEATALYGSQASNGAIIITTKKAKSTGGKILVSYDNNFGMQRITRFAEVNSDYGPGTNGVPTAPPLAGQFTSYGPVWHGGTQLYDNLHHFYKTGFSQTHNISLEFGQKNVGFRLSGQYLDNHGVIPFNTYTRYNFKLSNNTKIGKYISITPSIAYSNSDNVKPTKGLNGYIQTLYLWPANDDIRNYEDAYNRKLTLFNANYNSDYDNPLWSAKNNTSGETNKRWIATLGIDINPFPWLSLAGRFGYDTYQQDGYIFTHPQSFFLTVGQGGTLDNYYRTYKGYNHTITATFKKTVGDFTGRLLGGTMWQDLETDQYAVYGSKLKDSTSTDSSNTLESTRTRLLRNNFGLPNLRITRQLAFFGEAFIGYKNLAFLTYSYRNETASQLPAENRNYHYPGASLSLIMSDIFPAVKKGDVINYWKLRGSLAHTARLNDPYTNQSVFVNNTSSSVIPGGGFTYGFTNANPFLRPERQKTYEIGTEMRLLNNSISFEAAYYNTLCLDQISQGYRASYATGFVLNTGNAASLRNQGIEVTLNVTPVKMKDFNWDITFNFSHMWSKVLTLPESIGLLNDYYSSDTYITNVRGGLVRGHSTGTITGNQYLRNNAGRILIDPLTGLALNNGASNFVIGDRTPKFTLGTLNTLRYKNLSLSFLWDLKVGGDVYNGTDKFLTNLGKSARTSDRSTPIVVDGVLRDGLENTANPTKNTIVVVPYFTNTYYTSSLPDEEYIEHNVNWLRLRDITLNYRLSENFIHKMKGLKGLSFFITGNDLVVFTNYHGADPAVNSNNPATAGVGGYGLDYGSAPTPLSLSFGLRANF
jgi:TonB-linked SusC/RagA family outer membrane protein